MVVGFCSVGAEFYSRRKCSCNNMACAGEIKTHDVHHSPNHDMYGGINGLVKLKSLPISFNFLFLVYKKLV